MNYKEGKRNASEKSYKRIHCDKKQEDGSLQTDVLMRGNIERLARRSTMVYFTRKLAEARLSRDSSLK